MKSTSCKWSIIWPLEIEPEILAHYQFIQICKIKQSTNKIAISNTLKTISNLSYVSKYFWNSIQWCLYNQVSLSYSNSPISWLIINHYSFHQFADTNLKSLPHLNFRQGRRTSLRHFDSHQLYMTWQCLETIINCSSTIFLKFFFEI